jgi:transcriptional regulator with XRE-family HTH domain
MQNPGGHETPTSMGAIHNFGDQMKAARAKRAITQAALQHRLQDDFGIGLDTSGITRIEAGQREPRLNEALAIAAILGLELKDLTPALDLNRLTSDLSQQMLESREALLSVLQLVDQIAEYATNHPASLGVETLATVLKRQLDGFSKTLERHPAPDGGRQKKPDTRSAKLKSQVLSAVIAELPHSSR